jgi:hypothetical protein
VKAGALSGKASQSTTYWTISAARAHVHGYLITDDRRYLQQANATMFDQAAAHGVQALPISLCTTLRDDGRETVQEIIGRQSPEAWQTHRSRNGLPP